MDFKAKLKEAKRKVYEFHVEQVDAPLYCRSLTISERQRIQTEAEDLAKRSKAEDELTEDDAYYMAKVIARFLCDQDGNRVYEPENVKTDFNDVDIFLQQSLFAAILRQNGMDKSAVKQAKKNSDADTTPN